MYRFSDVGAAGQGNVVFGDEISFTELAGSSPEGRMHNVRLPVSVKQLRVLHVVEVDVGVHEI